MQENVIARNILIVDDNERVAKAMAAVIRRAGYLPTVFYCGNEALEYTEQSTPHAAVIDIHLPDISGLILTQELRHRLGPDVPIIIVSGDTSMENLNSLSRVGATYFFSKPIKSSQLIQRIKDLVV